MDVTDYLKCLNKSEIYDLGLVLGLDYHRVVDFEEKYSSNRRFLDSVVVSWLQKKDKVKDVSWKTLVEALRHRRLGHNGIATSIARDHGMDLPLPHIRTLLSSMILAIIPHLVPLTLTAIFVSQSVDIGVQGGSSTPYFHCEGGEADILLCMCIVNDFTMQENLASLAHIMSPPL